jgi:hypothetical protein
VVDVVVADEDPADVLRVDEAEHVGQVLLAVGGHAGVDDDGLLRPDHERVEPTETGSVPSPWWSWMRKVSGATSVGAKRVLVMSAFVFMRHRAPGPLADGLQGA